MHYKVQDALKVLSTFPIWWQFKASWTCPRYSLDGWLLFTFKHDSLTPGSHMTSKQMTSQLFWSLPKYTTRIKTEVISPNYCWMRGIFVFNTLSWVWGNDLMFFFFFFYPAFFPHIIASQQLILWNWCLFSAGHQVLECNCRPILGNVPCSRKVAI